jgi:hypothetical protein
MRWGPQTSPVAKASENERTKRNHCGPDVSSLVGLQHRYGAISLSGLNMHCLPSVTRYTRRSPQNIVARATA